MNRAGLYLFAVAVACAVAVGTAAAEDCSAGNFNSTFDLIQKAVFDNHGCS
ncbi:MAG: hypothetical protein HY270_14810, partial [Deltaproteobacteria bacterium]|nr:hypothetical protein [Deltaproteobacteria bacterium]